MNGDFRVGSWLVAPSLNSISCKGKTVRLEPKVMEVLVCLAQHAGETLPKETLFRAVWPDTFVTDDVLTHSISELRRAFEDDAREPRIIETIPKRGYRLVAPVEPVNGTENFSNQAVESLVGSGAARTGVRKFWIWALSLAGAVLPVMLLIAFNEGLRERLAVTSGVPTIHSIAVLPLQNLSGDPNQEYFSDGMTDALITDLAQIGSLKVISRTSSMRYKQTEKSLPEIARELNVDGIVEGTVQRSGDRVRITAQLVHAASDRHLWARSYERNMTDILALEDDVTEDIAGQIHERLAPRAQKPPSPARPLDPKVLDAYLQGYYHLNRYSRGFGDEEKRTAGEFFQQVIDAEPNFAPGYVGMAWAHEGLELDSKEDTETFRRSAEKAVQLDPTSSDARTILAMFMEDHLWDWPDAENGYLQAIALNPNNALAHDRLGFFFAEMGNLDESFREYQIAQQLDPNEDHLERILYLRREYDRAIQVGQMLLKSHSDNGYLRLNLYRDYTQKGMYKEAVQELEQTANLFGSPEVATHIHHAFATTGYRGAIQQLAHEFEQLQDTHKGFFPGNLALTYTVLGDKDRAFYWIEQAYDHHKNIRTDIPLAFLIREPMIDPLRSDPRFKDLLHRLGLPELRLNDSAASRQANGHVTR